MTGWSTSRRLLAAMLADGLVEGRLVGDELVVGPIRVGLREGDLPVDPIRPCPHPGDLLGPIRIDGVETADPIRVLRAAGLPYSRDVLAGLEEELRSSVAHAALAGAYRRPPPETTAGAMAWEQAIVEGHPTHPCHRTRLGLTVDQGRAWAPEAAAEPMALAFCFVERDRLQIHGPFEALLAGWAPAAPPGRVALPVHPCGVAAVGERFEVVWSDHGALAHAQTSLRTVCPAGLDHHLKLPMAVRTTSALRTISPYAVHNGPRLSALLTAIAPGTLRVVAERASAGAVHDDPHVARYLSAIVREDPERRWPDDDFVVAAGLTEADARGRSHVSRLAGSDPVRWLERYVEVLLGAVVPPMRDHGVAVEAHGQNTLVVWQGGRPSAIAIRDFGGMRVHRPTLRASGHDVALMPGSAPDAATLEEVWAKVHHCVIQVHLREVIRGLQLGLDGWRCVRGQVDQLLADHPAHAAWTGTSVAHKCLLRMRLEGRYRDYIVNEGPNPLACVDG